MSAWTSGTQIPLNLTLILFLMPNFDRLLGRTRRKGVKKVSKFTKNMGEAMNIKKIILSVLFVAVAAPSPVMAMSASSDSSIHLKETESALKTFKKDMKCMFTLSCNKEQTRRIIKGAVVLVGVVLAAVGGFYSLRWLKKEIEARGLKQLKKRKQEQEQQEQEQQEQEQQEQEQLKQEQEQQLIAHNNLKKRFSAYKQYSELIGNAPNYLLLPFYEFMAEIETFPNYPQKGRDLERAKKTMDLIEKWMRQKGSEKNILILIPIPQ